MMSDWIEAGQPAPDFELPDQDGRLVKLSSFRGRPVVLYFYPQDDTPGCTRQACAFRDGKADFEAKGAMVLGVSPDDSASHAAFVGKYQLNFPLLADAGHQVAERYGAWREKKQYGKATMGLQRSTFLINADGLVAKTWKSVKVDAHDQAVLKALDKLLTRS
jgi:peroxiredoxin Q/BCP